MLPLRKKEVIDLSSAEAQRRSVKEAAIAAEKMAQEAELRAEQEASEEAIVFFYLAKLYMEKQLLIQIKKKK